MKHAKYDVKATTKTFTATGTEWVSFKVLIPLEVIYADDNTQDKYLDMKDPRISLSSKLNIMSQMVKLIEQREDNTVEEQ